MKVTVLSAQAVRLVETKGPAALYLPDVLNAIQQRYGFVRAPRSAEEILAVQHEFLHGKFVHDGRAIVIRALKSFPRGFTVETTESTDDADLVLDDMLQSASETFKIEFVEVFPGRAYISHIEVTGDFQLERFTPIVDTVSVALQQTFEKYGQTLPPFRVHSIGLAVAANEFPLSSDFRVERRANIPYEAGVYFSQAPLRTADHIAMLEEFERVMQRAAG